MKIIITEQQFKKMINGVWDNRYLNQLLDKISESGIQSLTPEEKQALDDIANGRDVDNGKSEKPQKFPKALHFDDDKKNAPSPENNDDEYDGDSDYPKNSDDEDDVMDSGGDYVRGGSKVYEMFMELLPSNMNVTINDERWNVRKVNADDRTVVQLTNGSIMIYISMFYDGNDIIVEDPNGKKHGYKMEDSRIPKDEDMMKEYINNHFILKFIPGIIRQLYKKG